MVNSGSFDSDGQEDRNAKTSCTQPHTASDSTQSSSPVTASAASSRKTGCSQTADSDALAIGPTPTKTEFNSDMPLKTVAQDDVDNSCASEEEKSSLCCSLPLEKVQVVLPTGLAPKPASEEDVAATPLAKPTRKLLCLYCDRTFVSANLRQKHVERIHSAKKNRRVSSRKQSQFAVTQCTHCDRLNATENTLTDLFQHLVNEHSNKYFGCLPCEDRFLTSSLLLDHNAAFHQSNVAPRKAPTKAAVSDQSGEGLADHPTVKVTRSRVKSKPDEPNADVAARNKSAKLKELRCKKMSIKSSRIALKRRESKRLQALAKLPGSQKRRAKPAEKKQPGASKPEPTNSTKSTEKTKSNLNCVNPYPEFDNFYRVKKITDHSIDNLKISSLTFDDVFDKAFFNRIKCNIEENLLHHIDGKLFKNEESETRISNFEKVSTMQQEIQNSSSDNYGCDLSLNAVTPVPSLSLNSQFGEDFESQIEYGSKPSKKKNQTKKDEVHYKYFTRRKFQASILEQKENRDLSKLDMWTQLVIKNRQQKIIDDNKTAREILEYNTCNEYRSKLKREELNRILDRRGPFEDLREEASKKAALDKLNSASEDSISHESFSDVREVLDEILNRVFAMTRNDIVDMEATEEKQTTSKKQDLREIPTYLNLQRTTSQHGDIDKSDKITLICSSQETENFELPTNQVRGKNELVELSGEWARSRMYICAACGFKLPNMKYLLEHKTLYHQNVWVQHYEFVGNQSELYRHLSIPALGKVGAVENSVQCKLWKRSEARACTKCGKQCNSLGELHRHVLECGGDWTWMLARKKCKYRPFGAKSRKKRRGLVQRIRHKQKTGPTEEKKKYKKTFNGPRQRPSDADTIQRMLANLPAKRSTRKLISLYDGVYRARKNNQMQQNVKQKKVKCGKMIYKSSNIKETTEKTINTARVTMPQKNSGSSRRSLRSLNRVLSSRILDTNTKLTVKRKIKVLNERRRTRQSLIVEETIENNSESSSELSTTLVEPSQSKKCKNDKTEVTETAIPVKRTSPRSTTKSTKKISMKKLLTGNINIKSFFPVKKRENKKALTENQLFDAGSDSMENRNKNNKKLKEVSGENIDNIEVGDKPMPKKTKGDTFGKLVRSLSIRKKKNPKSSPPAIPTESPEIGVQKKPTAVGKELKEELDKTNKKRKLKRSFRNVINRVKRLKIDNAPETRAKDTTETNIKSTFLEERQPEKPNLPPQPVKIIVPSNLEAKENTADISETAHIVMNFSETNESSIVPENIFKLESNNEKNLQAKGELNFDMQPDSKKNAANINMKIAKSDETYSDKMQPITIETSEKPKIVPLISPNMKGKIRKPARGLNDCIAMLTNKLQQKTSETIAKVGILNFLPSKCAPKMVEDPHPPKTECILRIPTFKTQGTIEETALDLTTKPKTSFLNPPLFGKLQISNPLQNLLLLDSSRTPKIITKFCSIDKTIEDVVENKSPRGSTDSIKVDVVKNKTPKESFLRSWNSVDEIIQTVVSGYQLTGFQEKPRTTVDDIIDFVIAGKRSEAQQDFAPPDTLLEYPKHKTKSRSVSDIDLINPLRVEKCISANKLEQKTADISREKGEITRRSDLICDTIDFVIAGGSIDDNVISASSIETANILTDESNSKPFRKIGSKRKQKKKNMKIASDDVEEKPPKVEANVSEKNICATSTEIQSRQDNVPDTNEGQLNPIASNNGLNELDISKGTLDANNIPHLPEVTKHNIPLFRSIDDKVISASTIETANVLTVESNSKPIRKIGSKRKQKKKNMKIASDNVEEKLPKVEANVSEKNIFATSTEIQSQRQDNVTDTNERQLNPISSINGLNELDISRDTLEDAYNIPQLSEVTKHNIPLSRSIDDNVISASSIETANVLTDESNSKPIRKIGSKRKQKKKNMKIANDDVKEKPPKDEANVLEENLCASSTEIQSRQDNVIDTNEGQLNPITSNNGLNELDISRNTLEDANNIPQLPEVTKHNIPLFRENSQNLDSLPADSLDTTFNKAFLQSPELNPEQFVVTKVAKAAKKVGQARKIKFKQRKAVTIENKAVTVENKAVTVDNEAVTVSKVATVEKKALTAVIETHLDDLLDIKEMNCQSELSVSSFKVDSIVLSSEPHTKDLLLFNEDEPRVFENKAVVQHNPSDSEDDIPLILLKVNETNSNENEINSCKMGSALRLDQIDPENVTCLLIEELSIKKRSVSVPKPLCDQSKDSGIETDKSEESVSVDSEKTNLYLPHTPESVNNEINQKHSSIEEQIIDNSDSCASDVTPSTDIQKNIEYYVSDSGHKEASESLPNEVPHLDISSIKFESPSLNIKKPDSSKPRQSKSKKAVITEFKSPDSCESADMPEKLILIQNIIEKNSDSVINEPEPLTNVIVDSISTASKYIEDSDNIFITSLQTLNKRDSATQNISTLTSDKDISKDSLEIIECISNSRFEHVNDVITNTIKNKKKSKSKFFRNKPHIFNNTNVDQNVDHLLPTGLMKNKPLGKIFQQYKKKGRRRGKLSRVVENKKHKLSSNAHESEEEITDTLPLSVLASKDIPLVAGISQGLNEKEENKPILEKEETSFSLENGTTASIVSPGGICKLAGPSMTLKQRKNRKKIGKRKKKNMTTKLFLPISKIMETSDGNLFLLNPESSEKSEPVFSESLAISESPEIISHTSDNMEVNEVLEIKMNESIVNLAETDSQSRHTSARDIVCQTEILQLSGTAKRSRFNQRNLKQLDSLGEETSTGNALNNIETHTIKIDQRTSRSLEKTSEDGSLNDADKSVLPITFLTDQMNVTDSVVPNDEDRNFFTECVVSEGNVGTLAKENENENIFSKLTEDLFEEKLNEASENSFNEIILEDKQGNGNLLGIKSKKVIKKRSRSSKKSPISNNASKYEGIAFGDEKIRFIGEPVVDLVRCETQMLSTVLDAPFKDQLEILDPDRTYTKSEESQLIENSNCEQSKRSNSWKNTFSSESYSESYTSKATESYSESYTSKATESEKSKWKSPESTIDNNLPKTPTKRRSRSLKTDPIVPGIVLLTSIEPEGQQGSGTIGTPVKRNSRSLNNDRKDPSSFDSPLSERRSSDRDLSESDVEFKIKTPPKRSPRSLRTRKTVPDIKTSPQIPKEKTTKEESDYGEFKSITQVKKRARSLRNQLQRFSSEESSSATNEMKYLGMKGTELIESNLDSRLVKPRISRCLQTSFGVSSSDILNDFAETIEKGTEETETIVKADLTNTTLLSINNSLVASNETVDGIDGINSGFPNLTKGKKRTKSLKNEFKANYTNDLDTATTDLKDTEAENSVEPSIYSDIMKKAGDVLFLENETNDNVHSSSNKNLGKTIQNEKEEINTEMIAFDIMDTQVKPITKTRSRSLKNNANTPPTNKLPPIDLDGNYEVDVLKNNEYLTSANEMPRTKNIKRSTSLKENSTSSIEKNHLNKTFDQNQPETEGVLSSSFIKILKPLDSEIKDWKIKRLKKKSRFLKSDESFSPETCNKKIPEVESEEKRRVEVNSELCSEPNCQPSNLEFMSMSTRKVKQRRSKSLKVNKSTSFEVVDEKQLNLHKNDELKTKRLIKRSRSLKNVFTLPVSQNETFELEKPLEIKLFENVEVILNPLCSESEVSVEKDPRSDDKINDNEVTIIGTPLLYETEQSGDPLDDNIDNKHTNTAKKSSPSLFSELESSFDNINKMEDELQVDQINSTAENPTKRSKLVKIRTKQAKTSTPTLLDIKPIENIERVDLGVMKSNENLVTNETYSRSLRKKLAINYSEIEENNDINNPSISNEKLHTNTVIVKDDTEPPVDVKKSKSKKSVILVSDNLVAQNDSLTTDSSNIEVSTVGIDPIVDNMSVTGKNNEYLLKETASIPEKTVFDGNITEDKTIDFESTVLSTNKLPTKLTRNKKSLRKKKTKSKAFVKIHIKASVLESSNKDVESSSSKTESTSKLAIETVNEVPLKQLEIKEPPIKIIINTQKTRRKSKSIKKIGLKGQNDLFEDFALVIKKKRPIPMIAFTPPNTFTGETTYPCSISRTAEPLSDPAKDEDVIQADLDVSVEEMDMEIDEIPITSNIIENSLSLALTVSPKEGPNSDAVSEKEKNIKTNDRRKSNNKNKNIDGIPMEDLGPTASLGLPLEQEISLVPVLSHEILENKTEFISTKKGKRKTKTLRKNLLKAVAADVTDSTENLIIENVFSQPESITIEKKIESILNTCESVSRCSSIVLDEHEMGKTEPEKIPFAEEPAYETTDNQVLPDPSNKDRDIDRIYAFSETEDYEIEKPVELPRRLPRNKEAKVIPKLDNTSVKKCISIEELPAEHVTKQKSKLSEGFALDQKQDTNVGEIKEVDTETEDNGRRKSMRSAKAKALEHIHDDALAELTESERKKESKDVKTVETEAMASVDSAPKKNSGKKQKKLQKPLPLIDSLSFPSVSLDGESPILADLVAELHGLEELENSIERELNAEMNEKTDEREPKIMDLPDASNVEIFQSNATYLEENQERRRSRRGSKKVASYNENDLIDPLLDEIDGKRKPRKKDDKNPPSESKVLKKPVEPAKKLNSEELFDLLKASTTDSIFVPKQPNSFLNNLEDTARDSNHDHFGSIFEGVLEKSVILGQENAVKPTGEIEKIYEFTESPESSEQIDKLIKRDLIKHSVDDMISSTSNSSFLLPTPDMQDSSMDSNTKVSKNDKSESCYCEICNKSFIRIENLIKHRRTLTHIQKLSEIEAREAEKSKLAEITDLTETADDAPTELPSGAAGSIVEHPSTVQSSFSNSHTLKLADIINDVLNKPVLRDNEEHTFSDIVLQNSSELQPEVKRYKSLGERKSFDSDNNIPNDRTASNPFASKTTILEKQISLLEGIIENQATNNYIDDISISSDSLSGRQSPSEMSSKLDDDTTRNDLNKPLMDDGSFIKPVQYEEISEDSANLRNYEDQKLRKTLNRDEELFLECCSLLKSGSEVSSSYSNKRMHNKVISTIGLRQVDEPEWLEKKSLVLQEPQFQIIDDSDDNSRIPTPLGDSYDDDASNSNTISSNWDVGDRALDAYRDKGEICDRKFHFEDISKEKLQDQSSLKFSNDRTDFAPDDLGNFSSKTRTDVSSDGSAIDAKKIITKGARKVFEGLKVSIPTEELNLEEVLNCSPKPRKVNVSTESHTESEKLSDSPTLPMKAPRKSKPVKKSQVGSNLLFKVNKKKVLSPTSGKVEENESKNYDVYDFEETQDNTDVFTKPDYRTFRTLKNGEPFNEFESETDSRDLDSFSLEPESITSSTSSQCSSKKPKAQENITKKKCMIMGRIFKNAAAKSKIEDIDEEIRDIPAMDNGQLVESYVADCKKVIRNEVKPKLSEKEINLLFDQLLENKAIEKESANSSTTKTTTKSKPDPKKLENKKKAKVKGKKRIRTNSESTDDEFSLNKTIKKRTNRKNAKEEDNCINLEQELKECIGVASRKSQRKCTSGKQNVLVEYWSSDESQFEALLETQRIEAEPSEKLLEPPVAEVSLATDPPKELRVPQEFSKPKTIEKKPHKKKTTERKKSKPRDTISVVDAAVSNRRKRAAANPLYHWSSSSEDEANDLIEVKPLRDELEDDEDRPVQHGWIVGESPKKLVMMLAQAKGKKTDIDCVKEQGKKRTNAIS